MARALPPSTHVDADEGSPFENYELVESIRSMLEHNVVMADKSMLKSRTTYCGSDEN
jgi:hypothetical protein